MTNDQIAKDPMFQQVLAQAKKAQATRRAVLAGSGAGALAVALAACAKPGGAIKTLSPAMDLSDSEKVVVWDNWPYYMDGEADQSFPSVKAFEKASGIKCDYNIVVNDNNEYFAKIKNSLASGTDTGADTFCLTDWMAGRLIDAGYLQALQYDLLPNVSANLNPSFKGAFGTFDPGRKFSLTWKGIIAGIGYHKSNFKKLTGKDAPTSVEDLWNPALKGKISMLSEMRDTIGILMMADGVKIDSFTKNDFEKAMTTFSKYVGNGQIRQINGNDYTQLFANGDVVAGVVWAGDIVSMQADNPELDVVMLESGSTFACDNYLIPMGAPHAKNAHELIDFFYQPEVAANLALSGVYYVTPVNGAQEIAAKTDTKLASNELIFPTDQTFATKLQLFRNLTPQEDNEFSKAWSDASKGVV
ncbi:MAG: spermidine/putrescine ABC transporter substrate-binding protein [Actinomycetes bacterium]